MASFHNWTGDEEIDKQVPQFLNEDNAATQEKLNAKFNKSYYLSKASDLNSIRNEGFYICGANNDAKTMLNCPTEYAFGLMVWGTGEIVYQEVREYNRSSKNQDYNNCWRRSYYSYDAVQNAWSNWQKVAYTATTLAGYGITDGMRKDALNTVSVSEFIKRNVDTSYLGLMGGTTLNKGANIQLCGETHALNAGQFLLRAANSKSSITLLGNPSGILKWGNKNIVRSVNNAVADDKGNVKITVDAELNDTSTNPIQNKAVKTELDKKMDKTDNIYEANLVWGGRNIAGGYSPTDAGMVAELGANRFAFGKAAGITVEYSEDAGETWVEYPLTDDAKVRLFSVGDNYLYAGGEKSRLPSVNDMIRVTIDSDAFGTYTALNKFAINISTGGNKGCYCTIDAALESSPTVFEVFADKVPVSGWSDYNIINTQAFETYGNQPSRQYGIIRFTFGCTEVNTKFGGLALIKIMGFGGFGWSTPSNMAQDGHLYSYNVFQEATFPASITAPNFIGNINGYTINAPVPANAKFIDNEASNVWTALQTFNDVMLNREKYTTYVVANTSDKPITSTMVYAVTSAFTLDLSVLAGALSASQSSIFTAYFAANADYSLTISNAGKLKYVGSASDVAITSAGLLLNIWMSKDGGGTLTSIVQAIKLS